MNMNGFIVVLFKIGVCLLIAGKLAQVTLSYAVKMAKEEQSGLIKLGQLSRALENTWSR